MEKVGDIWTRFDDDKKSDIEASAVRAELGHNPILLLYEATHRRQEHDPHVGRRRVAARVRAGSCISEEDLVEILGMIKSTHPQAQGLDDPYLQRQDLTSAKERL